MAPCDVSWIAIGNGVFGYAIPKTQHAYEVGQKATQR